MSYRQVDDDGHGIEDTETIWRHARIGERERERRRDGETEDEKTREERERGERPGQLAPRELVN
jgi:hypothetical protein